MMRHKTQDKLTQDAGNDSLTSGHLLLIILILDYLSLDTHLKYNIMHNFKELKVWQKGRNLVKDIYALTKKILKEELFVMISQMRRAAISIPSNIAEGAGRGSDKDFCRFIDMATGSSYELESLIYVGYDLEYYSEEEQNVYIEKVQEIQKMLFHFKNHLNR